MERDVYTLQSVHASVQIVEFLKNVNELGAFLGVERLPSWTYGSLRLQQLFTVVKNRAMGILRSNAVRSELLSQKALKPRPSCSSQCIPTFCEDLYNVLHVVFEIYLYSDCWARHINMIVLCTSVMMKNQCAWN